MTELIFVIDHNTSEDQLLINLVELVNGKPSTSNKTYTPSTLYQLAPKDKETIDFLIKQEMQFQRNLTNRTPQASTTSFNQIHIIPSQSISALELLGNTQKLYFKEKHLVVDCYTQVEFYYLIKKMDQNSIHVAGRLKWKDTDISLQECDWIGAGKSHWFIRGISLKLIPGDVNWKHIKQIRKKEPWILSGIEKTAFLEEIDPNDPSQPKAVIEDSSLKEIFQQPDPLPLLLLKDRLGAFADLWMDYGNNHRVEFHNPKKEIKSSQGDILAKRQTETEKSWEKDLLESDFVKKEMQSSHYYCPIDKVAKSLTFLLELGWTIHDWKGRRVIRQGDINLTIQEFQKALIVKGKVKYEEYEADVSDVLGAFNRRERFVQLGNNTIGLLPNQWNQTELQELAKEGEILGQEIKISKSRIGSIENLFNRSKLDKNLVDLQAKLKNFTRIEEALPGEKFKGTLRPYQQQGLNWLAFLENYGLHGILADDMGLGKTIQVLALLSRIDSDKPHLIVLPTSLLFNWKNEIEHFLPHITYTIHQGPLRKQSEKELGSYNIILVSYTTLRLDLNLFEKMHFHSLILDEAQMIKNAHTQISKAVCSLDAQLRLSLTGTPLENHLNELWSHFHFLMPDLFGEESSFDADLQAAEVDSRYLQRIKKKIAPFILRRKKEEVLKDLPERIDQVVWVTMEEDQRQRYEEFLAGIKSGLLKKIDQEGLSKHRIEVFEAILRLRQICCHPFLVSSSESQDNSIVKSAKFDALFQDLETIIEEGRKVLIYSQFTSMLKLMTQKAKEKGWTYAYLDGSTVNREEAVSAFQQDASIALFFISLKAGGVGLNLTAADYVFIYDPWWNDAVEEQAINRAHRMGRKETVMAKRYVTSESIEEKMMKLKEGKRGIIDQMLDEDLGTSNMTIEDLRFLLS